MRAMVVTIWLVWSLSIIACASAPKSESNHKVITIDELRVAAQHTRKIEVVLQKNPPEYFSLILESQPGTGYTWRETGNTAPAKSSALPTTVNRDKTPGGVSETIFIYSAIARGTGTIEYEYRQEWEKNDPYLKKVKVDVIIR